MIGISEEKIPYDFLSREEILEIFARRGAMIKGHFVYKAGGHGEYYVDKSKITFSPRDTEILCRDIAYAWVDAEIEIVVGPAVGGIKIADHVARLLGVLTGKDILALYTEKDDAGRQNLKRGREEIKGKLTLVVEDIINTGSSIKETIEECRRAGAYVVGCHVFVDRSSGKVTAATLGVEDYRFLLKVSAENYAEKKCPLCEAKVPISIDVGHGAEYLKKHPEKADW